MLDDGIVYRLFIGSSRVAMGASFLPVISLGA
jgi:hypothetical protein